MMIDIIAVEADLLLKQRIHDNCRGSVVFEATDAIDRVRERPRGQATTAGGGAEAPDPVHPQAGTPRVYVSRRYQAEQLTSKTVKAQISGSGTANVLATDMLDVKISGSGSLTYTGNPQVTQEISGSGKLIKK